MANSSVPKHDFAPAWLKIPGESQSSFHSERLSRRDDPTSGKGSSVIGRQRQSSCDQQYPRRERHHDVTSSRHHASHRHHSIDIDESQYYNNSSSSCSLDDIATQRSYGSQPSLNRRPQSRQENTFVTSTAAYRGYNVHDFASDGARSNGWKRHELPNNSQNNNSKELIESPTDRFNLEFPSLRGDTNDCPTTTTSTVNGGVWSSENVRNTKIYLDTSNKKIQTSDFGHKNETDVRSSSPGSILIGSNASSASPKANSFGTVINKANSQNQSSSMFRVLVPTKQNILSKKPMSKETRSSVSTLFSNKISRQSSPTPQLEILNTRFVTHPKNLGNKKSDFLKTLRNEEMTEDSTNGFEKENKKQEEKRDENNHEEEGDKQKNGMEMENCRNTDSDLSAEDKPILSSSLEAEQRLLKAMGWKEEGSGDEDNYLPITEDERREFENLSKKIREQNTFQRPVWSPKKRIPFATTSSIIEMDDDSCSTTSSDSE